MTTAKKWDAEEELISMLENMGCDVEEGSDVGWCEAVEAVDMSHAAGRKDGVREGLEKAAKCIVKDGNPEVALEKIRALIDAKPEGDDNE